MCHSQLANLDLLPRQSHSGPVLWALVHCCTVRSGFSFFFEGLLISGTRLF